MEKKRKEQKDMGLISDPLNDIAKNAAKETDKAIAKQKEKLAEKKAGK